MQRVMGTFAPTRRGTRLRVAASKVEKQSMGRRGVFARLGLEREDLVAIPLCALWGAGMMRLAAQALAVLQSAPPTAVELALRAGQSPWLAALKLPVIVVKKWLGW